MYSAQCPPTAWSTVPGGAACMRNHQCESQRQPQTGSRGWMARREKGGEKATLRSGRENAGRLGRMNGLHIFTGMGNGDESCWMDEFV